MGQLTVDRGLHLGQARLQRRERRALLPARGSCGRARRSAPAVDRALSASGGSHAGGRPGSSAARAWGSRAGAWPSWRGTAAWGRRKIGSKSRDPVDRDRIDAIAPQSRNFPRGFTLPRRGERGSRVRITVLGKSPSWQDAGGACSGYLVEEAGTFLLLDCGNGVFSKLRRYRDYVAVDAIVVSHLHADHFLDLVPYAYALTYARRQQPVPVDPWPGTEAPAKPKLYAPRGARQTFRRIVGSWGAEDLIDNAFDIHEYAPGEEIVVGALRLRFHEVPHWLPTCAVEVSSTVNGSGRFIYGADTAPTDALVAFAAGTDLLMLEATLPRPERDGVRGHL